MFIALVLGTSAIVVALLVNARRPAVEVDQPSTDLVRATGKCAECHREETSAIVQQYEGSRHAERAVTCLDCHRPAAGQQGVEHKGFTIVAALAVLAREADQNLKAEGSGAALHLLANLRSARLWPDSFIFGAPVFAPLLFADLALLALLGTLALEERGVAR